VAESAKVRRLLTGDRITTNHAGTDKYFLHVRSEDLQKSSFACLLDSRLPAA
jgi:hypothetical protein